MSSGRSGLGAMILERAASSVVVNEERRSELERMLGGREFLAGVRP